MNKSFFKCFCFVSDERKKLRTAVLAGLFCLLLSNVYAQTKTVRGRVTDSSGQALSEVSVLLKGSQKGVISNSDGIFTITMPENGELIFSHIGYTIKTVPASQFGNTPLNVVLQLQKNSLNDIVVVGYGTQRRKNLTGSISQISSAEVKDMPVNNAGQQLQGKMAGVQINQNTGQPGANMSIRIRGAASINAGNNPLIVIDGFPTINGLETISPSDIESISVLKDASAAALYGSRAASGVILVTTKHAKEGAQNVTFTAYEGLQTVSKRGRPDLMNAEEFAEFKKEYYEDAATYEGYTGGVPEQYQDPSQYTGANSGTNWFNVLLRNALMQNYDLLLSSGTKKLKSVVNIDYNRQNGVMINQWAERYTGRANIVYDMTDRLQFGLNMNAIYRNQNITPNLGEGRNIIQQAYLTDPTVKYKNADGTYPIGWSQPGMFNVPNWYQVLQLTVNRTKDLTLISNVYGSYEILDGLKYKITANVNTDWGINRYFSPSTVNGGAQPGPSASASYNTSSNTTWLVENTLTYNKKFGKHSIEALAGYSTQKTHEENSNINGSQFPDDNIQWLNVAATRIGNVGTGEYSLISYIGRINYNYDEKYILSVAYRTDGSSQFGPNNRYGRFPSVSGGWIISDENFMKEIRSVSFLKIRGSWGKVGNNNIGNYTYLAGMQSSNYVFNDQLMPGSTPSGIGNSNLTWETTQGYDIGLDLGLFNNRISFTYDYYWKKTDGLLYAIDIPEQSGFSSITSNIGQFNFWGNELSIESKNLVGKLKWTTDFNISFDRNIVKKLGTNNAPIGGYQLYWDDNRTAVGHPIGLFYGYINTGVYMTEQEFETEPHDATAMVGTARFKDVNNDGVIDENDRTWIGNPNPDFTYGMTNQLSYKNFDFSLVVAGSVGNDIADDAFQSTENLDGVFNVRKGVANRWRSEADPGDGIYPRTRSGTTADFRNFTTRQVFSGTYIMGKNLTLGYTFDVKKASVVKSARIYFTAQNFFTLTKYPGMNPEVGYAGLNGLNQGRDFTSFPIAKTYALGLNVNF